MNTRRLSPAAWVVLPYAATALAWIIGSDYLLEWGAGASHEITLVSMTKGIAFVGVTGLLLSWLVQRLLRQEQAARAVAEATARELRELQTIAEHGGEIFYRHDLEQRFTYVSPQYQTLLGYGPGDLKMQWTELLTDNPINRVAVERTERAIRTGEGKRPT